MQTTEEAFTRLVRIMDDLREKCPWDRKQTIHTLRSLTIEETYELADAIMENDWKGIKEELGDLMLHLVFYAKIGREENQFTLEEMIHAVCDKLVKRHPHIYGNVKAETEEDVKRNWEKIKLQEGKNSVLQGVPVSLPATVKAIRLQEKAKQVGFEWEKREEVWEKVQEEMEELQQAVKQNKQDAIEEEYGDLMFSLVNYARFLQIDAETSLEKTNRKFIQRFTDMEQTAREEGQKLEEMSLQEMDAIWNRVKNKKRND